MNSPFPGMDPYLEQADAWHDFHEQFCMDCRSLIVPQLKAEYFATLGDHVYIHELAADEHRLLGRSDVSVASGGTSSESTVVSTVTIAAPAIGRVELEFDIERESFIEIRDRGSNRLVTIVEMLSPANTLPGPDREAFLAKRREILSSHVHYVEIDLLRCGPRMPFLDLPECDYCVMVSRAELRPAVGLWPLRLRDELPKISVPLSHSDEDIELDLATAFRKAFESAGYGGYIYKGSPEPKLNQDDTVWAEALLRGAGLHNE